jgi:hypothetical protein
MKGSTVRAIALAIFCLSLAACGASNHSAETATATATTQQPSTTVAPATAQHPTTFTDDFRRRQVLDESYPMKDSSDPNWWLNSGGRLIVDNGVAMTIHGSLPVGDRWRTEYLSEGASTATDTDGGRHPQNLFRLVLRHRFKEIRQQLTFRVDRVNPSTSSERDAWSGVFLMSRYGDDGQTLYYAGVRMDGDAVIKKKQSDLPGDHYADALAEQKLFPGSYNRRTHPNLIPEHKWIGIRSIIKDNPDGSVHIELWSDLGHHGHWRRLLTATDRRAGGVPPIKSTGFAGIRTDFMDASFSKYQLSGTH